MRTLDEVVLEDLREAVWKRLIVASVEGVPLEVFCDRSGALHLTRLDEGVILTAQNAPVVGSGSLND